MSNEIQHVKKLVELGIIKNYKIKNDQLTCCCPFHEEETPSFGLNLKTGMYNCFSAKCGAKGRNFLSFFQKIDEKYGINFVTKNLNKIKLINEELQNISIIEKEKKVNTKINELIFKKFPDPPGTYMEERIQRKEIRELFEIKFNREKNQYLIPIRNEKGELVSWIIRQFVMPKYKKRANFETSEVLFGLDKLENTGKGIVTEGPMDVIKTYDNGLTNCVALLGAFMSEKQEKLICKYFNELIVATDNDVAGKKCTEDIIKRLKGKIKLYKFKWISGKKDLGELTQEELKEEFKNIVKLY